MIVEFDVPPEQTGDLCSKEAASAVLPQPPPHLFGLAGNLPDIDSNDFSSSLTRLAKIYGPIYQLKVFGVKLVVLSSQDYVNEVCDEHRFEKVLGAALLELRAVAKDGLFTAENDEQVCDSFASVRGTTGQHIAELAPGPQTLDASLWSARDPQDVLSDDRYMLAACPSLGPIWAGAQHRRLR